MATVTYSVKGITCEGCANAIKRAVSSLSGVLDVRFNLDAKQVAVDYNESKISPQDIETRIEDAGYEATSLAA